MHTWCPVPLSPTIPPPYNWVMMPSSTTPNTIFSIYVPTSHRIHNSFSCQSLLDLLYNDDDDDYIDVYGDIDIDDDIELGMSSGVSLGIREGVRLGLPLGLSDGLELGLRLAVVVGFLVLPALAMAGFLVLPALAMVGRLLSDLGLLSDLAMVGVLAIPSKEIERERSRDIDASSTRARTWLPSLRLLKITWAPTVSIAIAAKRKKLDTRMVVWMVLLSRRGNDICC